MTFKSILVSGGAGFVGSVLVPQLLSAGYYVRVVDLMLFGETLQPAPHLEIVRGDFRDLDLMRRALQGIDAVIHLACISNDPCAELAPELTESEYTALGPLLELCTRIGVKRFIYASSSSVYGTKPDGLEIVEDLPLEPLTTYSKFKAKSEQAVLSYADKLDVIVLRPATVCGYSPRLRLDVVANALTASAYFGGVIKVDGGQQTRANIHIADMARCYVEALKWGKMACGQVFNVGGENAQVGEIATIVRDVVELVRDVEIETLPVKDARSYRLNSDKLQRVTGFAPKYGILRAALDLLLAFEDGKVENWKDTRYRNIEKMKELGNGRA